jgi:hypothetical protein
LPVVVICDGREKWGVDNIIAALEHNDRVCGIRSLNISETPNSQYEKVLAALQQPFPALTRLNLRPKLETSPVDPDSFLGGSAPQLRSLALHSIPFPGLPKLLLTTTHLAYLSLSNIPHSGYISPEAVVTCISLLTWLEKLVITFKSPQSRPDRER